MKTSESLNRDALQIAAGVMPETSIIQRDPRGLESFLVSNSPIRASIEIADPRCWLIETQDGERYGFTAEDVEREFADAPWTFEHYLMRRAELL